MNSHEQIVVITGAKGGLAGKPRHQREFLEAGARVFGVSLGIAASDFPNPRFIAIQADLSSAEKVERLKDAVMAQAGRIDGLVHLVGGFAGGRSVAETDDATFERMLDMNLRSAFYVIRAVLPVMRAQGSGRIVAIEAKR